MTIREYLDENLPGWFAKNKEVVKHLNDPIEKSQIREETIIIHGLNGFPIEANKGTKRIIKAWVGYQI